MRFGTRFMKVYRDLTANFSKSLMMASAIAIGVLSVGSILGAYAVLTREMASNYLGTSPADATVKIQGRGIDLQLVDRVKKVDGVGGAERHATILGRMKIGGDWYPMLFFVVDRFDNMTTNRFTRVSGAWPPPTGTMLVERTARRIMQSEEGGHVLVKSPHGQLRPLSISGVVHDPGLAPAWQEQEGYGYISLETLRELGESQGFDELRIRLANHSSSMQEIEAVSRRVAELARSEGYAVEEVQIPPPRRHPHQSQMNAILSLFLVFSFLTLVLSAILVTTSLATVMTRQVREIGVMKTIGASSAQIAGLYFLTQVLLALVAVAFSIPLSRHTAALLIAKISAILNLEIFDPSIPGWVFGVEALAGLLIPLAATAIPVWRGSRVSVREALDSYGVSATRFGEGFLDRLISRLSFFFSRGFALALRNIFRQRWRLVMSLGLLAAGGALFMTALNVSKAWDVNLQKIYKYRHYDLEMRLSEPADSRDVISAIRSVSGVSAVEAWQRYPTAFAQDVPYDIVRVYPDKGHGSFVVLGVPRKTEFVDFPMLSGRWLNDAGGNEVVLNHTIRFQTPNLRVGDTVNLSIQGRPTQWKLVGFVEDIGSTGATAYVPAEALASLAGVSTETANMIRVALDDRRPDAVLRKTRDVEDVLGTRAHVSMALPITLIRNAIAEHMAVLVSALLALSVLMALVGAFGLASTMSMNIMERTRELGVMRAIGATPGVIGRIVVDSNGVVYVFASQFAIGSPGQGSHIMIKSLDGGQSWTNPVNIGLAVDTCFLVQFDGTSLRCVMDGVAGARDDLSSSPSVDIANGAPTGAGATNEILRTWVDGRDGVNHEHVFVSYSTDGGNTWSAPAATESAGDRGYYSAIAISPDGSDAYLVYNAFLAPLRNDTTSPRALVGVVKHAEISGGTPGAWAQLHRGAPGDPRGSSQNNLFMEFLGDYVYAVATNTYGAAVWNDVRNAADCPAVDAWRAAAQTAIELGTSVPNPPAPQQACPATFGNSDIFGFSFP